MSTFLLIHIKMATVKILFIYLHEYKYNTIYLFARVQSSLKMYIRHIEQYGKQYNISSKGPTPYTVIAKNVFISVCVKS